MHTSLALTYASGSRRHRCSYSHFAIVVCCRRYPGHSLPLAGQGLDRFVKLQACALIVLYACQIFKWKEPSFFIAHLGSVTECGTLHDAMRQFLRASQAIQSRFDDCCDTLQSILYTSRELFDLSMIHNQPHKVSRIGSSWQFYLQTPSNTYWR
jgi:hypothetical protein